MMNDAVGFMFSSVQRRRTGNTCVVRRFFSTIGCSAVSFATHDNVYPRKMAERCNINRCCLWTTQNDLARWKKFLAVPGESEGLRVRVTHCGESGDIRMGVADQLRYLLVKCRSVVRPALGERERLIEDLYCMASFPQRSSKTKQV
jgi:hypothetical protein